MGFPRAAAALLLLAATGCPNDTILPRVWPDPHTDPSAGPAAGNRAIGSGANPARSGTPGGGSGGAIYNDGNTMTLSLCGVKMTGNEANEGGGAIFFVSNDRTGHVVIADSVLTGNPSGRFETQPGIYYLGMDPAPVVTRSTIQ